MTETIHDRIAVKAGIKRARVRCDKCKRERPVDGGACLAMGWPSCCGYTMTLLPNPSRAFEAWMHAQHVQHPWQVPPLWEAWQAGYVTGAHGVRAKRREK